MTNLTDQAHAYLAANAAESGADVLIAELVAEIDRLREAVEFFASDGAWLRDGPCDPNSSNFNGTNIARAALAPEQDK